VSNRSAFALRCVFGFLWVVGVFELELAGQVTREPWSWLFTAGGAALGMLYPVVMDLRHREPSRATTQSDARIVRAPGRNTTSRARPTEACTWRPHPGRPPRHVPRLPP